MTYEDPLEQQKITGSKRKPWKLKENGLVVKKYGSV